MTFQFHLAHPSQYYIFRNVSARLADHHRIIVSYNDKDVLAHLMEDEPFGDEQVHISGKRGRVPVLSSAAQFAKKVRGIRSALRRYDVDVVAGTSVALALAGALARVPAVVFTEDDFDVIALSARIGYPFARAIVTPDPVRMAPYEGKLSRYAGYQKLAYLAPDMFTPDPEVVVPLRPNDEPYALLRFASLTAHHDVGIGGVPTELAEQLVERLAKQMKVYISSEKPLSSNLEEHRLKISPLDIHHVLAHADLLIGDSQSMTVEAACLGVPSLRFSDFAGRLSVLEELEHRWSLTFGIPTSQPELLMERLQMLLEMPNRKQVWQERHARMLSGQTNVVHHFAEVLEIVAKEESS